MSKIKYKAVEKYLRSYGKSIIKQARRIIKQKKKNDSGKLLRSLKYVLEEKSEKFNIEFLSARHGEFINKGVQGLGRRNLPKGSTAGMHGGAKLRPIRTYIDEVTGKRKRSPYSFKTPNMRSDIMQNYVMRKGIKIPNKDGSIMSIKRMSYIIGRSIKAKGIQGISFYSQPISATRNLFKKQLLIEFKKDILNNITSRVRRPGNI